MRSIQPLWRSCLNNPQLHRSGGMSYPMIELGLLPLYLACRVWILVQREFRAGTLATLTHARDPREAHQVGGFVFFLIGYGTILAAIVRSAGISYPLIGLDVVAIALAFGVWHAGDREYREGLLGNGASRAEAK